MAPDLNSLPPSYSPEMAPRHSNSTTSPTEPQRSPSVSLAQAASINAGLQQQQQVSRRSSTSSSRNRGSGSPQVPRRRSNVAMTLNLNDPAVPGPGEMASPERRPSQTHAFRTSSPHSLNRSPTIPTGGDPHHHHRAPSLGELHQELEQEQEAQVVSSAPPFSIVPVAKTCLEPSSADDSSAADSTPPTSDTKPWCSIWCR